MELAAHRGLATMNSAETNPKERGLGKPCAGKPPARFDEGEGSVPGDRLAALSTLQWSVFYSRNGGREEAQESEGGGWPTEHTEHTEGFEQEETERTRGAPGRFGPENFLTHPIFLPPPSDP